MRIGVFIGKIAFLFTTCFVLSVSKMSGQETGQEKNDFLYPDVKESILYETQWQYTYTLHVESQTIIHRESENFAAYYYFRLDHLAEAYVNGTASKGTWKINGPWLIAPILNPDSMLVVKLSDTELVLETKNKTGRGNLQYFLSKPSNTVNFFKKPDYLLPELNVTSSANPKADKQKESWLNNFWDWLWGNQSDVPYVAPLTYINIEMTGGGFWGGIDPPIRNYIRIKTDGKLIREFATEYKGLTKTVKNISRTELEAFAEYIDAKGFFNLQTGYDCPDPICLSRLSKKPNPIPLRISVTYGIKHKVITIPIFGLDETNHKYLNYPPLIDNISEIMNRMANRIELNPN